MAAFSGAAPASMACRTAFSITMSSGRLAAAASTMVMRLLISDISGAPMAQKTSSASEFAAQ